jgi:hypothetical protein
MLFDEHIQELPQHLQEMIYQKTMELREPRTVLEPLQKLDIHTYSKFNDIIDHLMKQSYNKCYYLNWFENSLLYELNDNRSLFEGFSPSMYRAFKGQNDDEIISSIENEHYSQQSQIKTLKHYWKHLTPGRRHRLYNIYTNLFFLVIDNGESE